MRAAAAAAAAAGREGGRSAPTGTRDGSREGGSRRGDEAAARHARLRAIRSGSTAERLAAAREADSHSAGVLASLTAAAAGQKAATRARNDKFAWIQRWHALLEDETRAAAELAAWMDSHRALPLVDDSAGGDTGSDDEVVWGTVGEVADDTARAAYDRSLTCTTLRKRLRGLAGSCRALPPGAAADPEGGGSIVVDRLRDALGGVADQLWAFKEMLLAQEGALEGDLSLLARRIQADATARDWLAEDGEDEGGGGGGDGGAADVGGGGSSEAANEGQTAQGRRLLERAGAAEGRDDDARLAAARRAATRLASQRREGAAAEAAWAGGAAALGGGDPRGARGGRGGAAHAALMHVYHPGGGAAAAAPGAVRLTGVAAADEVARLVARLGVPFAAGAPSRADGAPSRAEVAAHERFYVAHRGATAARAARRERFDRQVAALTASLSEELAAASAAAAAATAAEVARREAERVRQASAARLAAARRRKEVEDAVAAEIVAGLAAAEAAVEGARKARAAAEAGARKAALEAYRREQADLAAALEDVRARQAAAAAEAAAVERAAGAVRVAARREATEAAREATRAALATQAAELEALREASLQRLVASVPYHARLAEIAAVSDIGRTTGATAASESASALSRAYAAFLRDVGAGAPGVTSHGGGDLAVAADAADEEAEAAVAAVAAAREAGEPADAIAAAVAAATAARQRAVATRALAAGRLAEEGQYRRAGYADKAVTSDPRWRLAAALRSEGLGHTSAGRSALAAAGEGARGSLAATRGAASAPLWGPPT